MEKRLEEQRNNGIELGRRIYSKEWIRPYESIWSIIQNIKLVNAVCDKDLASVLSWTATIKEFYVQELATYSQTHIDVEKIKCVLQIPDYHFTPLDRILIQSNQSDIIRNHVRICPICTGKYGYHSYFHQLSWNDKCPWHGCKLEETNVFYGLLNKGDYCFGLKANQLPSEVPLPSMRENISLEKLNFNLEETKQMVVLKDQFFVMKLESDWRDNGNRKCIYRAGESVKDRYLNILMYETDGLPDKDTYLDYIFENSKNGLLDRRNICYPYNSNYFTYCYLQRLLLQHKGERTVSDVQLENIFSFYKEEATDDYYALLMFAINMTRASSTANAFSPDYYLHFNSSNYFRRIADTEWIRKLYDMINDSVYIKSNINNFYDKNYFEACLIYEVQRMFLDSIWKQYLANLNSGISYADLSSKLIYPAYIMEEDRSGSWYITEII